MFLSLAFQLAFDNAVPLAEVIVYAAYFKAGFFDQSGHVVGIVHLAVAVGYSREIHACKRETQCGGLETLTVPKSFHYI